MADDPGNFFKTSRKGYDRAAVDAFVAVNAQEEAERSDLIASLEARVGQLNSQVEILGEEAERVADLRSEIEQLQASNAAQQQSIAELEQQVAGVHEQEEALKLTLSSAAKTRDEMLATAQTELDRARSEAREEADRIIAEAQAKADDIDAEIERLTADARAQSDRAADEATAEAGRITADATAEAEGTTADARDAAAQFIDIAKTEAAQLMADAQEARAAQEADLADRAARFAHDHADLTAQLDSLRSTYTTLAEQLNTILSAGVDALIAGAATITTAIDDSPRPEAGPIAAVRELMPPHAQPMIEAEPEPPIAAVADVVTLTAAPEPVTEVDERDDTDPIETIDEFVATDVELHEVDLDEEFDGAIAETEAPVVATAPSFADALKAAAAEQAARDLTEPDDGDDQLADVLTIERVAAEPEAVSIDAEEAPEFDADGDEETEAAAVSEVHDAEAAAADDADTELDSVDEEAQPAKTAEVDLDDEFWNPTSREGERGSFYSRRSGRLPRLGADASRDAMSAALGMRLSRDDD